MSSTDFDRAGISKVLVVRNDNLGDVICTTPAIEALRMAFPDAMLAVLCADYTREALEGNPYIDKLYSYEKAKHSSSSNITAWRRQWGVISEIRKEGFDLAIGIRSRFTTSHAWLVYVSGARFRVGHKPEKPSPFSSGFYNIFCDDERGLSHEVERSLNVVRRIGVDIDDKRLTLHIPDEELLAADKFIKEHGLKKNGKKLVCLHLTARAEHGREWPVDSYVKVIDEFAARKGVDLVLNWT
ncbi:MAG: hypothetical protein V3T30_02845, partial [Thermodesulfobacteriota bacterium]